MSNIPDPLADLKYDDSNLWSQLLTLADQHDPQLARNLEGFRVEGMKIIQMDDGNYVMRPDYTLNNWINEEDYKRYSNKYLLPHKDLIVELLSKIKGDG